MEMFNARFFYKFLCTKFNDIMDYKHVSLLSVRFYAPKALDHSGYFCVNISSLQVIEVTTKKNKIYLFSNLKFPLSTKLTIWQTNKKSFMEVEYVKQ